MFVNVCSRSQQSFIDCISRDSNQPDAADYGKACKDRS